MTVRIIQVGLGLWGRDWAANVLPRLPEAAVVAWADGDPRALRLAAEVADPPAFGSHASLGDALERVDAHAVLATVSIPAHTEVALTALRAGRHVLLEKPFAPEHGRGAPGARRGAAAWPCPVDRPERVGCVAPTRSVLKARHTFRSDATASRP